MTLSPRAQAAFEKLKEFMLSKSIDLDNAMDEISTIALECSLEERAEVMKAYTKFRDKTFPFLASKNSTQ